MAWRCKECGSSNFVKTLKETILVEVEFYKEGYECEEKVIDSNICENLMCKDCGNQSSIFCQIDDIAEWSD
ncbi:MAG: hypothetical protein ACRCZI_07010 [Cetobacterium sp.]